MSEEFGHELVHAFRAPLLQPLVASVHSDQSLPESRSTDTINPASAGGWGRPYPEDSTRWRGRAETWGRLEGPVTGPLQTAQKVKDPSHSLAALILRHGPQPGRDHEREVVGLVVRLIDQLALLVLEQII